MLSSFLQLKGSRCCFFPWLLLHTSCYTIAKMEAFYPDILGNKKTLPILDILLTGQAQKHSTFKILDMYQPKQTQNHSKSFLTSEIIKVSFFSVPQFLHYPLVYFVRGWESSRTPEPSFLSKPINGSGPLSMGDESKQRHRMYVCVRKMIHRSRERIQEKTWRIETSRIYGNIFNF